MILRRLTLDNFGLFREKVTLDLAPRRRHGISHPVVLVGGKNGAGKTTLLEAIRLTLYGKRALGARVSQEEYDNYLRGRIHRPQDGSESLTGASVGLEFEYAEEGRVRTYNVRRSWRARGRSVVESLLVEQDGEVVVEVPREEWHLFLQDLIPSGVSQLFFFDGEKIQEMAEGEHEEGHLADAIRGLLGIELVSRLRTDLGLYLARRTRGEVDRDAGDLERITRDLDVLDDHLSELHEAVAHQTTRRESEARSAEQARHRFIAEGGEVAARRGAIEAELAHVSTRISKRQQELRDLANGLLPFAVAARLTRPILAALQEATIGVDARTKSSLAKQLRTSLALWKGKQQLPGAPDRAAEWTRAHWADVNAFVRYWGATTPGQVESDAGMSATERDGLLERLLATEQSIRPRLESIANVLDRAVSRQRELQATLLKSDAASTDVLLQELQLAEQRLGAATATLRLREDELARIRGQRVTLERERQRILDSQSRTGQIEQRSALAARTIAVLGTYEQRLLESKLAIVRNEFLRCFQHLARKADLVTDVRIDAASFAVTLISPSGHEMPKDILSAGEKQVYATAMLWALARASGRPLPMVIDTPLARLDSTHRELLLTRYFPTASHQVILLSTDTEIDSEAVELLGPAISHSYRLEFDDVSGCTRIEDGYFWAPHDPKVAHALR